MTDGRIRGKVSSSPAFSFKQIRFLIAEKKIESSGIKQKNENGSIRKSDGWRTLPLERFREDGLDGCGEPGACAPSVKKRLHGSSIRASHSSLQAS
jgi:hypothetical protein